MGSIDVTELLSDPDFFDSIKIIKRKATVGDDGLNKITEKEIHTIGVIQPASGKTLQRLPEALRAADVSSFWVRGHLDADDCDKSYPTIIVYGCKRYQIQSVMDYTNWGAGWCEGTAIREKPAG